MTKARDIMTEEVATIRGSATVADAVRLMRLKEIHSLIVERRTDDDAYGIVTDTDIAKKVVAFGKDPAQVKVYEIMTKPCVVVNPDLAVEYVARLLTQVGIDRAPVIMGDLLGIISLTDILNKADFVESPRVAILERTLQQAISEARAAEAVNPEADATAEAWQFVEEIEAELAFLRGQNPAKSVVEAFNATPAEAPALATV